MNCLPNDLKGCAACHATGHQIASMLSQGPFGGEDRILRRAIIAPQQTLFTQGDRPSGLHCIRDGLIALQSVNAQGDLALVGLARGGDMIGYASYLSGDPHALTAVALVRTTVCSIPVGAGRARMLSDARLAGVIARCCLNELQSLRARMTAFAGQSNDARLCMVLLAVLGALGCKDPSAEVELPMSRKHLAALLSVAPETLSRILSRLRAEGIVRLDGRNLVVSSVARLRAAARENAEPELAGFLCQAPVSG